MIINEKNVIMADMVKRLSLMLLSRNHGMTMEQALSVVLNSDTCKKVMDEQARLYYQSPGYVFSFLESELNTGKMR
jgi:hypothetical protein